MSRLSGRRDGRRLCHYEIRGGKERVNSKDERDWRPAGSFAAQVLGSTKIILRALLGTRDSANGRSSERDVKRLREALALPRVSAIERKRLAAARAFAEDFVLALAAPVAAITTDGWDIQEQGFGQHAVGQSAPTFFDASPATVVYLSANAGFANGTLLWCDDCARFEAVRRGGVRKFCTTCRGRRASAMEASPKGLGVRKQRALRRFSERMRKAGFSELRLTKEEQKQLRREAKRRLREAKDEKSLQQWALWADEIYPKKARGAPRKSLLELSRR